MRRRELIQGYAGKLSMAWPTTTGLEMQSEAPLRDLAAARGILFGAAVGNRQLRDDLAFRALVARECALIVPENEMKWPWISSRRARREFSEADRIAELARANGQGMRGHTLLWHEGIPTWAAMLAPGDLAEQVELHIRAVTARFRSAVCSWDVVNEPIQLAEGRADGLRQEPFLARLGPDYISRALHVAWEEAGGAKLCVNDFGVEYAGPWFDARRSALLRLVERLRRQGAPLDAVGLQSHLSAGGHPFSERGFRRFLAELAAFGLGIEITELDVADATLPAASGERDRRIADEYERYLTVALDEPTVDVVVTWGLSDRYTWLNTDAAPGRLRRRDALPSRPLPFDADLRRKPAWRAVARALEGAPTRPGRRCGTRTARFGSGHLLIRECPVKAR